MYNTAVYAARQILDQANLNDVTSLNAPMFFNHVRFGTYFVDLVLSAAKANNFSPLFLFATIRQESMFQPYISSSAGALGLMQLIPDTGKETASGLGWPQNFTTNDLYNANVNITLGAHYMANQRDYLGGDLYDALAAYNAGPRQRPNLAIAFQR